MIRTQISLEESQKQRLDEESKRTGRSISDLIREAVTMRYPEVMDTEQALAIIRGSAGAWAGRDPKDDIDGETYVERLRSGRRLS